MEKKSRLLFVTQKINEQDDDLAFVTQWVDEFIRAGFLVEVICLEKGTFDDRFPVHTLGKELGRGKFAIALSFLKLIMTLKYDRVFVHMNPEYFTTGGWWWFLTGKPTYLWYTHYTTHIHLKLAAFYTKRMFAATVQSLPQYNQSSKKVVTGHGVDTRYWASHNECTDSKSLIMVHRLSRSKRVELGLRALALLPSQYSLTIYGRAVDSDYFAELENLVAELGIKERVVFQGPLPMPQLRTIYPRHRIMINMASETIDKTMLEAMCNGVFPVTTSANMKAIGLSKELSAETAEGLAQFILSGEAESISSGDLLAVVEQNHSLKKLVEKLKVYIEAGT